VILLGDFSGGSRHLAAASALGADAVVHDPEELARCAAARLPAEGRRRWGVRLMRSNGTLRLSPTGNLDAISVARLSDVALTRAGTYTRLVLDLSDLAAVDSGGVDGLGGWPALRELDDVQLLLLAGARVRPWLVESDLGRWTLVDEVAA
jgi:hypothetical protein